MYQILLMTIGELKERIDELYKLVDKIQDLECFEDSLSKKAEIVASRIEPMLKQMSDEIDGMNSSLSGL